MYGAVNLPRDPERSDFPYDQLHNCGPVVILVAVCLEWGSVQGER